MKNLQPVGILFFKSFITEKELLNVENSETVELDILMGFGDVTVLVAVFPNMFI